MDRPTILLDDLEIMEIISWGRARKEMHLVISEQLMSKLVRFLGINELNKVLAEN